MPYGQAKEFIQHARDFHRKASEFYQQLCDTSDQPRVKLLLDYLARHEKHLERALSDYETSITRKAMDTWYQFAQQACTFEPLNSLNYDKNVTTDEILAIGAKIDECLINSYKAVLDKATTAEVREIFESLLQMEEQEKHVKARMALGLQDM
ncbi:hypothetical protein [Desulfuromonas thiophila]|uniref:Rubrerythrin n=1 Tax=Desulfuromonas thiophila TaxID=57664 RepID=A0A1G6XBR3_9BACT|nr:hypothetical protein [Desulfuromonas thiophila]MCK9173378.1 hypothetical protein [Desulfuromonas thiophila]SDD74725.1 Rubrerythrin [Desulfuromonas thiophila]